MSERLPKPGEVWGDPANPKTWRIVKEVTPDNNTIFAIWCCNGAHALVDIPSWTEWAKKRINITDRLRFVESLSERVAAQAELLAKRAEKDGGDVV